ncbi:MAG: NADH dehydrogenase subunit, partial [Clostridia bacterium]|nr:NADH dehydrogenase subunit [Clostridia bacterium]
VGETVEKGQIIANPGKGLSVALHAPMNGKIVKVSTKEITIEVSYE